MSSRELPLAQGPPGNPGSAVITPTQAAVRRAAFGSIRLGEAADVTDLAAATRLDIPTVQDAVSSLLRGGQLTVDDRGRVVGVAGLSLVPAGHALRLGDREFHTWCAIDALGIPAALGADALARTRCPACGRSIELEFVHGHATENADLRAWLPLRDCCRSVIDELCPDMNLFCSAEHLEDWRRRAGDPPGVALTLEKSQELGRAWWGELVAEERDAEEDPDG